MCVYIYVYYIVCIRVCVCVPEQVLLVSGSNDPTRWVVPGGGIEPTEDTLAAALRESVEEAGAKGVMGRCLGIFEVSHLLAGVYTYHCSQGKGFDKC